MRKKLKDREDAAFTEFWHKELQSINEIFIPYFFYGAIFGLLVYSFYDYYSTPENWLRFLIYRILLSILSLVLLFFFKIKKINYKTTILIFNSLALIFFAYGASLITGHIQLMTWNLSISVATLFWPYFILVIHHKYVLFLNSIFMLFYCTFYYFNSSLTFSNLIIYGGNFLVFAYFVSPYIAYTRYRVYKNNAKLKYNLSQMNSKLQISNKQLQEINSTKDKFFSIIAHDLKNPFNSLIGFSNMLVEDIENKEFENIEKYSKIIQEVSIESYHLLNNLLEWSLAQEGKILFKPQKINLLEAIENILSNLKNLALYKKIDIITYIPKEIEIFADKNMFSTIIRNLVTNAIKYSNLGGEITIKATETKDYTQISITDKGIGINPEVLERIFDSNVPLSTKGTQKEAGTGLGLILCTDFIKKHKGKIWAKSKLNEGTSFNFTIPKKSHNPFS